MRHLALVFLVFCSLNLFARENTLLDTGWKFFKGDGDATNQPIGRAELVGTNWQDVSVPHCWGQVEAQQGDTNYYRGPAWYQRDLAVPRNSAKRYFLRFEAASSVADVYLNGNFIGEHRGAFGAFCFEITTNLSTTGTNLLQVRVDNSPQHDIAPLNGDFSFYGGIYRPVHLVTTEANCFTPTDHGSPGVAWLETSVTKKQAVLDITAQVSGGAARNETLIVVASLFDADGQCVATTNQPVPVTTNAAEIPCWLHLTVRNPHLWNGRLDPYLYKAVVELRKPEGAPGVPSPTLDSVERSIGLRSYYIDPDKGFFLNGKHYALHGVDKHQERWDKGWAVSEADLNQDIALIKELGATCIRCAHYQHSDYFYSLCDQAGILVWAELPQVDEIDPSPEFAQTSRSQLLDLIRQNVNHPSIFVWSLFNELRPGKPDPHRELEDLKIVANGEDPTRPTVAASNNEKMTQMNRIPDVLAWNHYPGWYPSGGGLTNFSQWLDKMRYTSRHGGFAISEYGAGANFLQHEQDPKQPVTSEQWHPEEWQSYVHEQDWAILKSKSYVWATFVWVMFDFTIPKRHEGGVPGRNDKGLVTSDRTIKKDAFYFYKANWSDEPMVYITERRFTERTNAVTDVKIYSNAKKVELLVNGAFRGSNDHGTNGVFLWKNITLKPGDNQIEAKARRDGKDLADNCTWKLNPQ